ncbi:prion-inhibition and propagation-domain-containing protein [Mycena rebaudengoi]|nr:prion-inhibition and propagation-domain-containing protein [Mycena rebaudengoi]
MADPIAILGLLGQCYGAAVQAYLFIQTAIAFPETATKLVIQLEVERIRFQLWGRNSGADSDALRPGLAPFAPLIVDILTQIQRLLSDSDQLKAKYGLTSSMDGGSGSNRATGNFALVDHVKELLRFAFAFTATDKGRNTGPAVNQSHPGPWRQGFDRLSWALVSKTHFESLIAELRRFTDSLNQLLRESQLTLLSQQWHSIEINAVARANDVPTLNALQEAAAGDKNCQEIFSMAKRKTLIMADERTWTWNSSPGNYSTILSQENFELPANFPTLSRCIAKYRLTGSYVLIERRSYQPDNRNELFFRLHQLIELVNASASQNLLCEGYWSEARRNCWYLVYRFPHQAIAPSLQIPFEPISLRLLLSVRETYRPPLEARQRLACALAASFSRFYGSKWLHKAVRSENIVFPCTDSDAAYDIAHPIVVGFTEFSRPLDALPHATATVTGPPTSWQPLSRQYFSLAPEYRIRYHPQYLNTSIPYSMAFDIYSFGLVLVEIGWWLPLDSFQTPGPRSDTSLMQIMKWVEKDLAYKMGTPYKDVVEWCLTRDAGSDVDLAVEFYTKVVVPLWDISRWGQ